jgi:hypothetical protein
MPKRKLVLSSKKLPASVRLLCGNPPVLSSEKRRDYESVFCYIADCVKPTDFIEWLWLKDIVDHTWEIRRLRRFKNQLIEIGLPTDQNDAAEEDPFADIMATIQQHAYENPIDRFEKKEEAPDKPKKRKRRPSEADAVQSFRHSIGDYQTLDRLLISAEDRRNAVLREIDRRRDGLVQSLRRACDDVIDAEFSETAVAAE